MRVARALVAALLALAVPFATGIARGANANGAGRAKYVVVTVWDGLRPDLVNESNTPTLYKLSKEGVFFGRHHSVYPTSTEVNGTAIATGAYPSRSGIIANKEYRREIDPLQAVATEGIETVQKGDELTDGKYLGIETLAEIVEAAGYRVAIAGTKPVALLHNRRGIGMTEGDRKSTTIFSGKAIPEKVLDSITTAQGPFPATVTFPNAEADIWTTKALTEVLWSGEMPKFSLLWLSDPDYSQHNFAPGSPIGIASLKSCDANLASLLAAIDEKGVREATDLFVVSDHGFSTISSTVDVAAVLSEAGFNAVRQFRKEPKVGDVLVVSLGGSTAFYVIGHDPKIVRNLVEFLQQTDFAGVLFTREPFEGTFALEQVQLNTAFAPDVMMAFRWTEGGNNYGIPGLLQADIGRKPGQGTHASLSALDVRNTLIATGPDFRLNVSNLPSSNLDLAPTILWILGLKPPQSQDGRVLFEAIRNVEADYPKPESAVLTASCRTVSGHWRQYLKLTRLGSATYVDEGNGSHTTAVRK
ncbi:MAG TPA: alkaline phosphatase family protein [Terrimicrobiaceae bacterium]